MSLFKRKTEMKVDVTFISHTGETKTISSPPGHSVMEVGTSNGIDGIVAECGGSCMCATCHVYVDEAFLPLLEPIMENEEEMLDNTAAPRMPNSRLSCQIQLTEKLDGLIVTTPEMQQ
jgi:2Fe-2S ferredoxin